MTESDRFAMTGRDDKEKLVRNYIPQIIRANGERPITRTCSETEYPDFLVKKLQEEVGEYLASPDTEELVDILEVVYTLAARVGINPIVLERDRLHKRRTHGNFDNRTILVRVE